MALIATSIQASGVARMFFDLRATHPNPDDEPAIAEAIEQAFELAAAHTSPGVDRQGTAPTSGLV